MGAPGAGAKMLADATGAVLGQFVSLLPVPINPLGCGTPGCVRLKVRILYQDSGGMIVGRLSDGTLAPFLTQAIWYDQPLCQGNAYLDSQVFEQGMLAPGMLAGSFLQIGIPAFGGTPEKTQPYYYKIMTTPLQSVSTASALDYLGNCNAGTFGITSASRVSAVTPPPAPTVPGPLQLQP
jgi:hypothetical protein